MESYILLMPQSFRTSSPKLHATPRFLSPTSPYKEIKNVTMPCFLKAYNTRPKLKQPQRQISTVVALKYNATTPAATSTSTTFTAPALSSVSTANGGIGILEFLEGKNYFITGATGFLGKALIEKILRTAPNVGKIFVLIKAKSKEDAMNRLKNDIIDSELFECLRQMYGTTYDNFVQSKLIPVVGNVCDLGLGMDESSARKISEEVHVFIHSAANTTFDERYDVALITNTRGPSEVTTFAKKCKNLLVLLHVSTTYVNGEREGIIMEKPFNVGHSIAMERITTASDTSQVSDPFILDVNAEMKLALAVGKGSPDHQDKEITQKLKALGMERAKFYGWRNTYELTKAMGEMVINGTRGDIPVVILRPSVITSTYKNPFPGWIQGNRMLDPLLLSYGKGRLPGFFVDPEGVIDVIPVDMVVNAMLGAITKHGVGDLKHDMTVYQVGSSTVNPLLLRELFDFSGKNFVSSPFVDWRGERVQIREMNFFDKIEKFSDYIWSETEKQNELTNCTTHSKNDEGRSQRNERKCKKMVDHTLHLARIYEPYMFCGGRFDNGNTQKLVEAMSEEELKRFDCDVRGIDWKDYLANIHLPGLRKHVMKGR